MDKLANRIKAARKALHLSQSELAAMLDIEKATLGRLLDRMAAKGWVRREQDAGDKRTKRVYLTESVQPLLQVMRDLAAVTRDEATTSLSGDERTALRNMLQRMRDDLSAKTGATQDKEAAE